VTGAQAESLRPFQALSWESNRFSGVTTQGQIYFYKPGDLPAKVYRLDLSTGAMEGTHAFRFSRRKPDRSHPYHARRQVMLIWLSPHSVRSLSRRRIEVK
jgi:hypothetical protein